MKLIILIMKLINTQLLQFLFQLRHNPNNQYLFIYLFLEYNKSHGWRVMIDEDHQMKRFTCFVLKKKAN